MKSKCFTDVYPGRGGIFNVNTSTGRVLLNGSSFEPDCETSHLITYSQRTPPWSNDCDHLICGTGEHEYGDVPLGTAECLKLWITPDSSPRTWSIQEDGFQGPLYWLPTSGTLTTVSDPSVGGSVEEQSAITIVVGGGLRANVNLPCIVIEMRDLGRTVGPVMDGVLSSIRMIRKPGAMLAFRKLVKQGLTLGDMASTNLWYGFGAKPLPRDLRTLWEGIKDASCRVLVPRIVKSRGDIIRCSFSSNRVSSLANYATGTNKTYAGVLTSASPGGYVPLSNYTNIGNSDHPIKRVKMNTVKGTVYGRIKSDIVRSARDTELARYEMASSLGASAWAAIPFSFVVDWFYSVQNMLQDATERKYALSQNLQFEEGIWSAKRVESNIWQQLWSPGDITARVTSQSYSSATAQYSYTVSRRWRQLASERVFSRHQVGSLHPQWVIGKKTRVSGFQIGIAAALIAGYCPLLRSLRFMPSGIRLGPKWIFRA